MHLLGIRALLNRLLVEDRRNTHKSPTGLTTAASTYDLEANELTLDNGGTRRTRKRLIGSSGQTGRSVRSGTGWCARTVLILLSGI